MTVTPEIVSREGAICFPLLGGVTFDPPASFSLFGREIYFYGVIIALAFFVCMLWCLHNAHLTGMKADDVSDAYLWMMPCAIIGARAYYVLFRWDYFRSHPGEILAVWEGGLAIYGGIIAGIAAVILVCRHKKISPLAMLDLFSPPLLLGQAIGRWRNFFNREAFGAETGIFCRMGLETVYGEMVYVHPTFLYESVWNLTGFFLLRGFLRSGKRQFDGQCVALYFLWYGTGRAFIEGLRTDSLLIPSTAIRVSQLLSVLLAFAGAFTLLRKHEKHEKP